MYEIVVYGSQDEYRKKTGQPDWSAGVTVGNSIYTWYSPVLNGILSHEMTHLIWFEYMNGRLTDQQAWDVAAYIDGKPRPQDPRWAGSPAETRRKFHNGPQSLYGTVADGVLLGGDGPPKAAKGRQGAVTAAPLPR